MKKHIALTGGIGCGKSVVARVFSVIGVPVYDSDSRARALMEQDDYIISSLQNLIGEQIYENGHLQKKIMANAIFTDKSLCEKVNAIVHPRVWLDYEQWSEKQSAPFTIMETALLYESDLYKKFDFSIVVVADDNVRIQRVMKRDNCDANSVLQRINSQSSIKNAAQKADYVIENNNTFVISQIINVYNAIKKRLWD
ncbi:MAG: dephospho-CoA kinase [Bacteroidales bacterium]|nr:dephospho-CoA kinase [Bacteroidales bacterium]